MSRTAMSRPMRAILDAIERSRTGDVAARVPDFGSSSEAGRVAGAVNALLDAAGNREAALRARIAELDAVYALVAAGLGFVDLDLRYVKVNAQLAELLPSAAARIEPLLRRALAGEAVRAAEIEIETGAGTPGRRLLVGCQPALTPDGRVAGVAVWVEDVTGSQQAGAGSQGWTAEGAPGFQAGASEREAAEAELQRSRKMQVVGELTGGVAHDFSNLLTAIIGNLELAQVRAAEHPDITRLLESALRVAQKGAALTKRMLMFGRGQCLHPERVDVAALLDGLTDMLTRSIGPRVKVHIVAPSGVRPAQADPNQIELAVLNLAVNARDAMPGGGAVTITLAQDTVPDPLRHPAALLPGDYVRISVADTGTGMDPETKARAFETYFTTKPVGRGSGLGLSMVHALAVQSGGGAAIESAPGEGTTVSIWLPCAPDEDAPEPARN